MKAIANRPFLKARQNLSKTWTPPVGARIPTRSGLSSNENLWLENTIPTPGLVYEEWRVPRRVVPATLGSSRK
jgi:hypothetical protein